MRTPLRSLALDDTAQIRVSSSLWRRIAAAVAALAGAALCGCSLSLPGATGLSNVDFEATGSIAKPAASAPPSVSPLSRKLDVEDWRRARAAMAVALDPQGNGATVAWDNPDSGRRGSFVPVAAPYPVDGQVCRAFIARIDGEPREQIQGAACRIGGTDDWDVKDARPFRES